MIEAQPVMEIKPSWASKPADRYVSHPALRTAFVQVLSSPGVIYVISDQKLPTNVRQAVSMVEHWKADNEVPDTA